MDAKNWHASNDNAVTYLIFIDVYLKFEKKNVKHQLAANEISVTNQRSNVSVISFWDKR